jgi:hypothetical protein
VRLLLIAALSAVANSAAAQGCLAPENSNEAIIMGIKSVPIAFSPARAPNPGGDKRFELGIEGLTVPKAPDENLAPNACGGDDGLSNTNQLVVAARPRARVALGGGFAIEAGWVPPIPVSGVTANLFGGSLNWVTAIGPVFALELRAHGATGTVKGAFTCTEPETVDPTSTCFGASVSNDSFKPLVVGGDLSFGGVFAEGRARPYVGGGYSYLRPEFEVNYTTAQGQLDNSVVEARLNRIALFGGFTFDLSNTWSVTGQLYAVLDDASTVSFTLRAAL